MFCKNCGKELKENQKFCPGCGCKVGATENNAQNNKIKIIAISIAVVFIVSILIFATTFINKKSTSGITEQETNQQIEEISQEESNASATLNEINKYQAKYFEIIKRNNVLLAMTDEEIYVVDLKDLNELFEKIENKINSENIYMKKYREIQEKFEFNTGNTTIEMNDFAKQHYDAVDKLLNDVYKEVKANIPESDFEQLKSSQIQWLKDVEAYKTIFDSQDFGSIDEMLYLNYQIDMRNFRTLLLMLYL